ncbi:MAG: alpha-amylase family glycosyl hydrolase [Aestuariibacter sp.]
MHWWKGAAIYQIYPRSYCDSNNDGIGDLPGITAKLPYIASLNVDAIWISPFFLSPMKDFGYDVEDYRQVDPIFGTLADFKQLLATAHKLNLKVVIDQVISHTSDRHIWFQESRLDKDNPKADWYVWADANADGTPPTNWHSVFGGSAWQWDSRRSQYYLHNFLASQPDLNFHNPTVRQQMKDEMRFWLEMGVDGFRLDTVNYYFHDKQLRNNPAQDLEGAKVLNPYYCQQHLYDKNQPENAEFTKELRKLTEQYAERILLGEIGDIEAEQLMAAYTGPEKLHTAYSFRLLSEDSGAEYFANVINQQEQLLGDGWPTWAFSNHDVIRVVSRWQRDASHTILAELYLALLISLKGNICIYQGEELGLTEAQLEFEQLQDPWGITFWPEFKGRDGCRTPMPWDAERPFAGFSDKSPWLPVPAEHQKMAVKQQQELTDSVLQVAQRLLRYRQQNSALKNGTISRVEVDGECLWFSRQTKEQHLLCCFNLGNERVDLSGKINSVIGPFDSPVEIPEFSYQFIELESRTAGG